MLTKDQLTTINQLQKTTLEAEESISQGMDTLQKSLSETLASDVLLDLQRSARLADYMSKMSMGIGKLSLLKDFLREVIVIHITNSFYFIIVPLIFYFFSITFTCIVYSLLLSYSRYFLINLRPISCEKRH